MLGPCNKRNGSDILASTLGSELKRPLSRAECFRSVLITHRFPRHHHQRLSTVSTTNPCLSFSPDSRQHDTVTKLPPVLKALPRCDLDCPSLYHQYQVARPPSYTK
ncbi:hypothetical protein MPH_05403 [Macrophomina phaseolina MS6]|uniref:Uncharacterized protein n=1 Tax=Macrophomina phaseolina (strain MS6) TaxID=1126212 RepID=K2RX80_MACPH|nr:hypothetical protein MPH_05403 [Macrophomina phaseolina MS6]